jgi:hypothetical protein
MIKVETELDHDFDYMNAENEIKGYPYDVPT